MYSLNILKKQFNQVLQSSQKYDSILNEENIVHQEAEINQLFHEKQLEIVNTKVKIFVIGAVNSGKSTLINAIVGMPLLPTGFQNKTEDLISIKLCKNNLIEFTENELQIQSDNPLHIRKIINKNKIRNIQCQQPYFLNFSDIELIDSPGFKYDDEQYNQSIINSISQQRKEKEVLSFFVLVVNQNYIQREYQLMREIINKIIQIIDSNVLDSMKFLLEELDSNNCEKQIASRNTFIIINLTNNQQKQQHDELLNDQSYQESIFRIPILNVYHQKIFSNSQTNFYQQMVEEFRIKFEVEFNLQNESVTKQFITKNILNNNKHLMFQDFNYFQNQLKMDIIYEFNKIHYNLTHFKLQSKLCIMDQIQQNMQPQRSQQYIHELYQFFDQKNKEKNQLINIEFQSYKTQFIQKRKQSFQDFIQNLQHTNKHELIKQINQFHQETSKFLTSYQQKIEQIYHKFIENSKIILQNKIGSPQESFDKISLSNLNSFEQCELIIKNIEEGLVQNQTNSQNYQNTIQGEIEQKVGMTESEKSLQNTIYSLLMMLKKITFRENNIGEILKSTFDLIKNEQVIDLNIIRGNLYFAERQMIKCILDQQDNYCLSLCKIMEGLEIFLQDIYMD